jgi:hypothetical protein
VFSFHVAATEANVKHATTFADVAGNVIFRLQTTAAVFAAVVTVHPFAAAVLAVNVLHGAALAALAEVGRLAHLVVCVVEHLLIHAVRVVTAHW